MLSICVICGDNTFLINTVMKRCTVKHIQVCVCTCMNEILSVMSNSLWPLGPYTPWNSPGQNTEAGSLSLVWVIIPTQVSRISGRFFTSRATRKEWMEWVAYPFSSGSSEHRNWTGFSYIAGRLFTNWTSEKLMYVYDSSQFLSCLYHVLALNILVRDSLCCSVFSYLCVLPLIQSSISRGSMKTRVRTPRAYILLKKSART